MEGLLSTGPTPSSLVYEEVLFYDSLCPLKGIKVDGQDHPPGRNAKIVPLGASGYEL